MPKQVPQGNRLMEPLDLFADVCDDLSKIDLMFPMYSLWSVGMPPPGPDYIAEAEARSGEQIPKTVLKGIRPKEKTRAIEWLEALYRASLYRFGFEMKIQVKQEPYPRITQLSVGHKWGLPNEDIEYDGPCQSKVMVIGKHPGWEDLEKQKLFSGPTSQELLRVLDELNVSVDTIKEWYVTNIVRFPNLNAKSSNTMQATWVKDCLPLLHQELRLVKPDFILVLGDEASKALLKKGLSETAGQVIDYVIPRHEFETETPILHTAKLMTCMHPARVARQPDMYPQFLGNAKSFVDLLSGKAIGQKETDLNFYEISDQETLEAWADLMLAENNTEFALDCEWHGEWPADKGSYLRTVQIAWKAKHAVCVVVRSCDGTPFQGDWVPSLLKVLKNTDKRKVRIIGHNFKADLPWLIYHGVDLRKEFEAPIDDPNPDGVTRLYGWQKTKTEGGFDTMLAVHSWQETHPLGLEMCTSQLCQIPRYDLELEEWKTKYCKEKGIKKSELGGYGDCPDEILHPYANYDSDSTFRLYEVLNKGEKAKLDYDRYGNSSRKAFWITMRAAPAFLEMEMTGVMINVDRAEEMISLYSDAKEALESNFKQLINWPDFKYGSANQKVELLFGEEYTSKRKRLRPQGALSLDLKPIKSTGRRSTPWNRIEWMEREAQQKGQEPGSVISKYNPSTDKETLGILASNLDPKMEPVRQLRDLGFIGHLLKSVLRPPKTQQVTTELQSEEDETQYDVYTEDIEELDEDGNRIYEKGVLSYLNDDDRVRPSFWQTKETGRASCSAPNFQAISKRREEDYQRILKKLNKSGIIYKYPLRSIIRAAPGHVLVEADYSAAEVAGVAWMSGDQNLIEHARRSALPEDHPDYYDIHSNVAVRAFNLSCKPTKKGLKAINRIAVRTGAKSVFFGYLYGQGAESAARKAREEGADVSTEDAQKLIDSLTRSYPGLVDFFKTARSRVHEPGWIQNCFGRFRRFSYSTDRQVMSEAERQGMNFPSTEVGEIKQGEFGENHT